MLCTTKEMRTTANVREMMNSVLWPPFDWRLNSKNTDMDPFIPAQLRSSDSFPVIFFRQKGKILVVPVIIMNLTTIEITKMKKAMPQNSPKNGPRTPENDPLLACDQIHRKVSSRRIR